MGANEGSKGQKHQHITINPDVAHDGYIVMGLISTNIVPARKETMTTDIMGVIDLP